MSNNKTAFDDALNIIHNKALQEITKDKVKPIS